MSDPTPRDDAAPSSGCAASSPSSTVDTGDVADVQPEHLASPDQSPNAGPSLVNLRNFSIKCGRCGEYQAIVGFRTLDDEWNEYAYECESPPCSGDPSMTRTLLEIPADLDEFARRDPGWHGGEIHAGAKHGEPEG